MRHSSASSLRGHSANTLRGQSAGSMQGLASSPQGQSAGSASSPQASGHKLEVGKQAVFAQVKEMADELDAGQFFAQLEEMIDQVRRDLELIPEPDFREELREVFKEVINYALSLKLGDALVKKAM